jgi:ADP-dependent NAD(P)H-hydrate dehydratase
MSARRDGGHCNGGTLIDDALLRDWPLPIPSDDGDKEQRGRFMVIAGSREMPGAVILAATAALRAGAGKLTIATGASVAQLVALAMPESRVIALPETARGGISPAAAAQMDTLTQRMDAVLIGPGMLDEPATCEFTRALLPRLGDVCVVLDAAAMSVVRDDMHEPADAPWRPELMSGGPALAPLVFRRPPLLTPHAGEMAHLTGEDKDAILADPVGAALAAARRWNAVVALKGATTVIALPDGRLWRHEGGNIGLAVSGSGDTLSGVIAGLAARGAPLEQASAWGVALHARAGERLAARFGTLGYLAREIAAEIPPLMQSLGRRS